MTDEQLEWCIVECIRRWGSRPTRSLQVAQEAWPEDCEEGPQVEPNPEEDGRRLIPAGSVKAALGRLKERGLVRYVKRGPYRSAWVLTNPLGEFPR